MFSLNLFTRLKRHGLLGINQRNADFILRYNARNLYPLVDDKLKTKKLALKHNIQVPELYHVVEAQHQIKNINTVLGNKTEFVVKPAHGSGGNGIMVIKGKVGKFFQKSNGDLISLMSLEHYVSNILSGMYSLSGNNDQAIFEYRVNFDPFFDHITYQGVPDIRVIVFRGVPAAAMMRLPTSESDGKANLHQGAMGIGIEMSSGKTTSGVLHNKITTIHPDTAYATSNISIPRWDDILNLAMRCADIVGLQYLGVDIVLDKELGPLMLELNARPGLNVQLANKKGLLHSLQTIEQWESIPVDLVSRKKLALNLE